MGFKRLEKNLIDIIKEEQAKLGFRKEEIRLYYPLISLNHFFEADDDVDEMQTRLEQFPDSIWISSNPLIPGSITSVIIKSIYSVISV